MNEMDLSRLYKDRLNYYKKKFKKRDIFPFNEIKIDKKLSKDDFFRYFIISDSKLILFKNNDNIFATMIDIVSILSFLDPVRQNSIIFQEIK